MTYFIIYLLIGAIWSTICEFMLPDDLVAEFGGNMFTRWLLGAILWPLEVFFLIVEVIKEK